MYRASCGNAPPTLPPNSNVEVVRQLPEGRELRLLRGLCERGRERISGREWGQVADLDRGNVANAALDRGVDVWRAR